MAELNVNDITTNTIDPTDKVFGFSANESKAPTVETLVNAANGKMAIGVCETAAVTAAKVVTCAGWNGLPGQPILINFTNENIASNPTLNINSKGALPIYNGSTREEIIPAGNMLLIVNADSTKLQVVYAPTTNVVESGNSRPVSSKAVKAILGNYAKITKFTLGTARSYSFTMELLHAYRITIGHPILSNKSGHYFVIIQNDETSRIDNLSNENNYTLSVSGKVLIISSQTDYGLGYIEDMGTYA